MIKKGLVVLLISASTLAYFFSPPRTLSFPCAFCNPTILANQVFYEDSLVMAMCTHKPIFPGHCLIIPKRHVERFDGLTIEEITEIGATVQKVHKAAQKAFSTNSYILLQKNGVEAGQTVPHVHFHYIPRKSGDESVLKFLFYLFFANAKPPLGDEQIREVKQKIIDCLLD